MSLWWVMEKGGILMWPLLAVSVVGLAVFLERFLRLLWAFRGPGDLAERVAERVLSGDFERGKMNHLTAVRVRPQELPYRQ